MRRTLSVSSLLFVLAISDVLAQVPTGVSNTFEVPEAAPLRPPKPYNPSLTPRVDFLVVASLPGNVPCSDLSADDLEQLAIGFCGNLGQVANLSSFWFPETCKAACAQSGRRLLQVNPIVFNQDCVRATEDPEDVPQANKEAMALEQEALVNNLLQNSLDATLPGTTILEEKVTPSFVDESSTEADAKEDGCNVDGFLHPHGLYVYSKDSKKGFCQCCQGQLKNCKQRLTGDEEPTCILNENPENPLDGTLPEKQNDENESCLIDGAWYQHGLFVYCKDCVYNYCRCCNGAWKHCTNALTGSEAPSC